MDQFSKDGRKLRPRKKVSTHSESSAEHTFSTGEHSHFDGGSRRSFGSERRSFGEGRPAYGDRKPFGERRSFGEGHERRSFGEGHERRSFGDRKPFGERRSFGENHHEGSERHSFGEGRPTYGDRKPFGERRSFGDRKPFGDHKSFGDRKPFGERRSFGENHHEGSERHSFGEGRPTYGDRKPFGERRSFGDRKPFGEHKSFGDRKPFGERRSFGDRKPFGDKRSFHKADSERNGFNKESNEGIQRMIDSTPRPMPKYSDNDYAPNQIREEIRLNKFIANSGVCSRREADTMIQAGVVTVNDQVITELGTKVNVFNDVVKFNGETLKGEAKVYLIMNKPRGYVTTASDPHAEKTVMDLIKGCSTRVYPVGRLDKATTGVLMFTNDGEIAERLTHPSYDKKKIYQVILNKPLDDENRQALLNGVELSDGKMSADSLEYIDPSDKRKLGIEIHSGKNRVVRRLFEAVGFEVRTLDRVYFAGLTKKGLKKGEWRYLTEGEMNILKMGAYV